MLSISPFSASSAARAARAVAAAVLLTALASGPAVAQSRVSPIPAETKSGAAAGESPGAASSQELGLHVYTLRHQRAAEAARVIRPLLSSRGTVVVQEAGNTLQVRDSLAALSRILPELRSFDRPGLELEIRIVRASTDDGASRFRPPAGSPLPPELASELRKLTSSTHAFTHFDLVAEAELTSREGEEIAYEIGERYTVVFRLGPVVDTPVGKSVQLNGFRVLRGADPIAPSGQGGGARVLLHTSFSLVLDRTMALGLARAEASSSALMVILHCRQSDAQGETRGEAGGGRPAAGGGG